MLILMSIWTVLRDLMKKNCQKSFYSSTKDGKIGLDGKIWDGHISAKDYLICEKIWDKFEMKNMGDDYHDHYLKKDVLLLADVSEKFIGTCLKYYGLDPCHYYSSPDSYKIRKNIWYWQVLIYWKRIKRMNFLHF